MTALRIVLQVLLVLSSFFLIMSILLHKGKGGGLSDMFGGGISSSAGSSGVAERNLNRITVGVAPPDHSGAHHRVRGGTVGERRRVNDDSCA